ncbi:MAG TPA: hypothetical protein VGW98_08810 [Solirubrobacteraceae bacterium]|nr:hypothetical protein [Solirubrobacteraceae bacterium]
MTLRITRLLLVVGACLLVLAPAANARSAPLQTLKLRAPVPAAGDMSIVSFELSIGGEGKRHHRQVVSMRLINHKQTGVFALARLLPVAHHPGRFLGVLEVFHRATASKATLGSASIESASPLSPVARTAGAVDEFVVRARNEHIIVKVLKANIVALAEAHHLSEDDFCSPLSLETYLRGNAVIGGAFILAGPLTGLPTNLPVEQLGEDAIEELCDGVEDDEEGEFLTDDETESPGLQALIHYLRGQMTTTPPATIYRVLFSGAWSFEGTNEVKLTGRLSGASLGPWLAHSADSTNPVDTIKVVLPPAGTTPRKVTNYICPPQLPIAAITTTSSAGDTLMCSGGSLALGQQFSLNVQSSPAPSTGMGGQLLVHQDGAYLAPFSFGGP